MANNQKQIKYCLPLQVKDWSALRQQIIQHRKRYDYIEVWFGALKSPSTRILDELIKTLKQQLILVLRQEAHKVALSTEEQLGFLRRVSGEPCLVDLDIAVQREVILAAKKEKLALHTIYSYHDYVQTPSLSELEKISRRISDLKPEILKISCRCNGPSDAIRLLDLGNRLSESKRRHIVLGMGAHGAATRTFGTLWGNEFIFAPNDKKLASAPGQLTRKELVTFFNLFGQIA